MNYDEKAVLHRRVDDWRGQPIEGHGLWARYCDAVTLIADLMDAVDALTVGLGGDEAVRHADARLRAERRVAELEAWIIDHGWHLPPEAEPSESAGEGEAAGHGAADMVAFPSPAPLPSGTSLRTRLYTENGEEIHGRATNILSFQPLGFVPEDDWLADEEGT